MKFVPLILAGMFRKRARALLMLLQIASAFLLFGLLQGFNGAPKVAIAQSHADRLYVASSVTLGDPGFGFAALLALIGSAVPAWRGLRLKVVDALADL